MKLIKWAVFEYDFILNKKTYEHELNVNKSIVGD